MSRPGPKDLRPASFRGVKFEVESREGNGGRRGTLHEYPGRDEPYWQDMGRKARGFKLQAWTGGGANEDWIAARDKLIEALEREGAGDYVDPSGKTWRVVALSFGYRDQRNAVGVTEFTIDFAEAGSAAPESSGIVASTRGPVLAAGDDLALASSDSFARRFSLSRQPGFVRDDATRISGRLNDRFFNARQSTARDPFATAEGALGRAERFVANPLSGTIGRSPQLDNLNRGMSLLSRASRLYGRSTNLMSSPGNYALQMFSLYELRSLVPASRRGGQSSYDGINFLASNWGVSEGRTAARNAILDQAWDADARAGREAVREPGIDWAADPAWTDPATTTPSRAQQAANSMALADLATDAALAAEAQVVTAIVWDSRSEAESARAGISRRLEARALVAGDRGEDDLWRALSNLQATTAADIDARALYAPELARVQLAAPLPGLVLADRLYQDLDREPELLMRNRVAHPAFAGAGELEVRL